MIKNKLKIIDIGHSNFNLDKAMIALETEISQIIFNQRIELSVTSLFLTFLKL